MKQDKSKNMKTITILLTRYKDFFGRVLCDIGGDAYSHASISIDENEEIFYSFNKKGFVVEKPKKYMPKKRMPDSACIRLKVPEEVYFKIQQEIQFFLERKEKYSYSLFGTLLCFLHIPHKFHDKYFCSQFVAELLEKAGAVELRKEVSLYLPSQLLYGWQSIFAKEEIVFNTI